MARVTVSIPDDLREQMEGHREDANWSAVAANAFRAEIHRIKVRNAQSGDEQIAEALERLRASKANYERSAGDRGAKAGTDWAMKSADYAELKALHDHWGRVNLGKDPARGVWATFGDDRSEQGYAEFSLFEDQVGFPDLQDPADYNSADFWRAFGDAAIRVFKRLEA